MELKVVSKDKNSFRLEIVGEDHTLCNALRKELWEDQDVVISGYRIEHSLTSNPVLVVETKNKNPKVVLDSAVKRLMKKNSEFRSLFNKNIK